MYRNFRDIAKELGYKGWRYEIENNDRMYLTKFDPNSNDDEYRVYFFLKEDEVQIVRRFRILKYKIKENIRPKHRLSKEAEAIINTYYARHKNNHFPEKKVS